MAVMSLAGGGGDGDDGCDVCDLLVIVVCLANGGLIDWNAD